MSVYKVIGRNKKNTYYKTCPDCGSNLDPGEVCSCQAEGWDPYRAYLDDVCRSIREEWEKSGLDESGLSRDVVGKIIVGVLPDIDMNGKGNTWCSGFFIYLLNPATKKVSTLRVESLPEGERCSLSYYGHECYPDDVFAAMEDKPHEGNQSSGN